MTHQDPAWFAEVERRLLELQPGRWMTARSLSGIAGCEAEQVIVDQVLESVEGCQQAWIFLSRWSLGSLWVKKEFQSTCTRNKR